MLRAIASLGGSGLAAIEGLGRLGLFLAGAAARASTPPFRPSAVVRQIHFIGARSVLVIAVAGLFTGMVVALQFHDTLVRFGSVGLLGAAVGLSLVRELGPVLTALMVIGRAGSAVCAELGIMRSEEQIDALECMSIDPLRHLVAPRLVAGILSLPLLVAMFDVIGIAGGWFVGVVLNDVSPGAYFGGMYDTLLWSDVWMGIVKSLVFGMIIAWVATARGYYLHLSAEGVRGAEGVSRATTDAVVWSAIAVLAADYLVSALLL